MELKIGNEQDIHTWEQVTLVYHSALKQINTKIEIINDEAKVTTFSNMNIW